MSTAQSTFEQGIASALKQCVKLIDALDATQELAVVGLTEEAYEKSFKAAEISEKLTLLIRTLPACTGHANAMLDMECHVMENIPVRIGYTREGWFTVRIPALLPRKKDGGAAYIQSYLYTALLDHFRGRSKFYHPEGYIILRHIYDRRQPERQYRDHDNIEVKQVIDIVASFVMVDDAPLRCPHLYCSAVGDENCTEIYVVPETEFGAWLEASRRFPDGGVILYEKRP